MDVIELLCQSSPMRGSFMGSEQDLPELLLKKPS
jgi:hypothetical protein